MLPSAEGDNSYQRASNLLMWLTQKSSRTTWSELGVSGFHLTGLFSGHRGMCDNLWLLDAALLPEDSPSRKGQSRQTSQQY